MAVDRLAAFVDALRKSGLLSSAQIEELAGTPLVQPGDPVPLARELVKRKWLTKYQATCLLQGRGQDLVLGPYCILDSLGEGGMGQVFRANHQLMKRVVALKLIRKEKLTNPDAVRRFYAEIRAAAQLTHPNIVVAYDAGEINNIHYFAMEYVEGIDLSRLVKESGPLPTVQACDFIRQAALGLQHAHECGLVHRDIKPSNLLVTRPPGGADRPTSGSNPGVPLGPRALVKILDMGLARLQEATAQDHGVTQEGKILGTPDYVSPEQALDSHVADVRSDLYSLGCTFYFLLTGQAPFPGKTVMEVLLKHQMDPPPRLEQTRPDVPPSVAAIVQQLMAKRPEERFQTPGELALALELFCRENRESSSADSLGTEVQSGVDWGKMIRTPDEQNTSLSGEALTSATALATAVPMKTAPARRKRRWILPVVGAGIGVNIIGSIILGIYLYGRADQVSPEPLPDDNNTRIVVIDTPKEPGKRDAKPKLEPKTGPQPANSLLPKTGQPAPIVRVEADGVRSFIGHAGPIHGLAISRDGRRVLTGGADRILRLWEVDTGRVVQTFQGHASAVGSVDLHEKYAVSVGADTTVRLWDVETGQEVRRFSDSERLPQPVYAVAFSADGTRLLTGGADKVARLWEVETGKLLNRLEGHGGTILSLAISPNASQALSGATDSTARLWDLESGQVQHIFADQQDAVTSVGFSRDGSRLLCGNAAGAVQLIDLQTKNVLWSVQVPPQSGTNIHPLRNVSAALSPDGRDVLAGGEDGVLGLWNLAVKGAPLAIAKHAGPITGVAFSPDGTRLFSAGMDRSLRVAKTPNPTAVVNTPPPKPPPQPTPTVSKPAVPDETKQAEAEQLIRDQYKDEYAKKTNPEKLILAAKELERAIESNDDPVTRFVLLREARDLAAQAGDGGLAINAIEELSSRYLFSNVFDMKLAALTAANQAVLTHPGAPRVVAEGALVLAGEALAVDDLALARRALAVADAAARRASSVALNLRLQARTKELDEFEKEYESVKAAEETLKQTKDDAEANRIVGKYLCSRKGLWDKGLSLLAAGNDAPLGALAKQDLARPQEAQAQIELGDRWWDLAQAQQGSTKPVLQERAAYWYTQALAKTSDPVQTRIKKRIEMSLADSSTAHSSETIGQLHRLGGHTKLVTSVSMSRDGRRAISGGADGMIKVWDTVTGKELRPLSGSTGEVKCVAISPDGGRAVAGSSGVVRLWDLENGNLLQQLGLGGEVECCAFSADGRRIIAGGDRGVLAVWMTEDGRRTLSTFNPGLGAVRCLASTPDDRYVFFVPDDGKVHGMDVGSSQEVGRPLNAKTPVLTIAFAPNGKEFITAAGKLVRIWDVKGKELRSCKGHTERVTCVAYSGDGRLIISGSDDKTVRVWDAKSGLEVQRFHAHTGPVTSVAISGDGRRALSGGDKAVRVWGLPK